MDGAGGREVLVVAGEEPGEATGALALAFREWRSLTTRLRASRLRLPGSDLADGPLSRGEGIEGLLARGGA